MKNPAKPVPIKGKVKIATTTQMAIKFPVVAKAIALKYQTKEAKKDENVENEHAEQLFNEL